MPKYAADTQVSVERSRAEIEATLRRYGADAFGFLQEPTFARIGFRLNTRQYRFTLPMPDPTERRFTHRLANSTTEVERSPTSRQTAYDQAVRQLWRGLALLIKAKLEAVEAGIVSIEDELLAATVTASGETVGEVIRPQLLEHYRAGLKAKPLMLGNG